MKIVVIIATVIFLMFPIMRLSHSESKEAKVFKEDIIKTSTGDLKITFIGHGTLMFTFGGKTIHADPVSQEADYSKLPKADIILVTHEHQDHLDPSAIKAIKTDKTDIIF
ncbi:MAG: MBL fold metallo-hydrolase [Candidatus Poribacteria bacterium]